MSFENKSKSRRCFASETMLFTDKIPVIVLQIVFVAEINSKNFELIILDLFIA